MSKTKTASPVVHFEILGRDAAALRKFYAEALGWDLGPADESPYEYAMVNSGAEKGIAGGIGKSPDGAVHLTFYAEVDNPQAALDRIEALGGRVVQPVTEVPGGPVFATFADPEGHIVGLVKG